MRMDDPEVKRAGVITGLVSFGYQYMSTLPEDSTFHVNTVWIYTARFIAWLVIFGLLYVGIVAVTVPFDPESDFKQYARHLASMFLYLCSATLVWTAVFPGVAIVNPLLWNNFGWIYIGVVTAMFLVFWNWRTGSVRRLLVRSERKPFRHTSKGFGKSRPAASVL